MYTTHTKLNFLYKNINIDLQNSGVFWPRKGTLKIFFVLQGGQNGVSYNLLGVLFIIHQFV